MRLRFAKGTAMSRVANALFPADYFEKIVPDGLMRIGYESACAEGRLDVGFSISSCSRSTGNYVSRRESPQRMQELKSADQCCKAARGACAGVLESGGSLLNGGLC